MLLPSVHKQLDWHMAQAWFKHRSTLCAKNTAFRRALLPAGILISLDPLGTSFIQIRSRNHETIFRACLEAPMLTLNVVAEQLSGRTVTSDEDFMRPLLWLASTLANPNSW